MKPLKRKIRLENALHKFFFNHLRGWGWLVTTVTPPTECTTEHLRTGASEIIGERGRDRLFFYGLIIQSFPEILKNNCNEKLLKIGITGVGKTKINFTSNKIWIKNRTSFICPYYLKHSLFSYGRKLLLWSYLSHNFHKHGVHMAKVYRALIDWLVETQDSSRVINLHRKRTLDGCFHKKLEIHVSSSLSNKQKHSASHKQKFCYFNDLITQEASTWL